MPGVSRGVLSCQGCQKVFGFARGVGVRVV